jgi:hypothetical protein
LLYYIKLSLRCICKEYNDYNQCVDRVEELRKRYDLQDIKYQHLEKSYEAMLVKGRSCTYSALCDMMVKGWKYYNLLVSYSTRYELTAHMYSYCITYALASLWVFAPNCRAQSIELLTKADFDVMENSEEKSVFELSKNFKTSQYYTYQLVFGTDIAKIFVKHIRPHVIPNEFDSPTSILFPTFEGRPLVQGEVNKKINKFFFRWGLNISITSMRKIVAAHMKALESKKQVSGEGNSRY